MLPIDLSRAYDRPQHEFIEQVLLDMRFGERFVTLIMNYFRGPMSRVMINGYRGKRHPIQCGVKQGDPLSPTIFAIILEPMLCAARKLMQGMQVPRPYISTINTGFKTGPGTQHDLATRFVLSAFTDDAIFGAKHVKDLRALMRILHLATQASGLKVNGKKSRLIPLRTNNGLTLDDILRESKKVSQSDFDMIKPIEKVKKVNLDEESFKYLGVHIGYARILDELPFWGDLIHQMKRRLNFIQLWLLPLGAQCWAINTFVMFKIVYHDQFMPLEQKKTPGN